MSYIPTYKRVESQQKKWKSGQTMWRDFEDTDYWNHNFDDYDEDGMLKESATTYSSVGSYAKKVYDYGKNYWDSATSASSKWASRFKSYGYSSYSETQENSLEKELGKELKAVARAVNSVRNVRGSKREQRLKVTWSDGTQSNNVVADSNIYISPDAYTDDTTLKPEWSKDKRRDVLIGGALTAVGMKRMTTPMSVKKILKALNAEKVRVQNALVGLDQVEIKNSDLIRNLAITLWKALEQNAARAEIMREYRGSAPYFATHQLYHSDDRLKEEIVENIEKFTGDLEEAMNLNPSSLSGISIAAAQLINWNINHSLIQDNQIELPQNVFGEACSDALELLHEASKSSKTSERWEAAHEAATILAQLEPQQDQDQPEGDQDGDEEQDQGSNGNQPVRLPAEMLQKLQDAALEDMFKEVGNGVGVKGEQDCDSVEDDSADGLTEASTNCEYKEVDHSSEKYAIDRLADDRAKNEATLQRIARKLDPISEQNILPEHGLRSGRMTGSKLWKVTTNTIDSDRIFHQKIVNGVTRNLTIGLLLDYSASMDWLVTHQRRIAVLINDLMEKYPNIQVLNFAHQGNHHHNEVTGFKNLESLVNHRIYGGTEEGSAYAYCARKIIQNSDRKSRKILFAIGDGHSNRENIKNAVQLAKQAGVETVDILLSRRDSDLVESAEEAYGKGQVVVIDPHQSDVEDQVLSVLTPWLVRLMSKLRKQQI